MANKMNGVTGLLFIFSSVYLQVDDLVFFFQLDKEIKETWDAAADAGYFTYRLDHVEGRVAPGKYSLLIQVINPPIKYNIMNIYFSYYFN